MTLLNLEGPPVWDEVSHWTDRKGSIAHADLCRIAVVDTLKASKMLKGCRALSRGVAALNAYRDVERGLFR
ncbi:MAG TPA: hypothetical protein VI457_13085 [Methylococcaceae bacterium]|nr:hypothetical protein [Methylococcaceae bacterium]